MFYPAMSPCSLPRNLGIPQQYPLFQTVEAGFCFLGPKRVHGGPPQFHESPWPPGCLCPWSPNCCRMLLYNSLRFAINRFLIFGNMSEISWFTVDLPPFNESKQTFKKTYYLSFERKQITVTISTSDFYIKKGISEVKLWDATRLLLFSKYWTKDWPTPCMLPISKELGQLSLEDTFPECQQLGRKMVDLRLAIYTVKHLKKATWSFENCYITTNPCLSWCCQLNLKQIYDIYYLDMVTVQWFYLRFLSGYANHSVLTSDVSQESWTASSSLKPALDFWIFIYDFGGQILRVSLTCKHLKISRIPTR